ncbi:MAG: MBL fold metallo-hydrolase [Lachnospiraceae bacterium]
MIEATVLADNIASGDLKGEWGLSIFIKSDAGQILLDAGASKLFLTNAENLKLDLRQVDFGVLSHAHYDHSDGMREFFRVNPKASFYLREGSGENCYLKKWIFHKYIGLPKRILKEYEERIVYVSGDYRLADGVSLIPHKTEGLSQVGRKNHMYVRKNKKWLPDDFSHEQSLVFDTENGLVIFNSCSHTGADNIIREVSATYPGKKVRAIVGGFHIFDKSESEVRELAKRIKAAGVEEIYTGHCTGGRSFKILKEELGDCVHQLRVGLLIKF